MRVSAVIGREASFGSGATTYHRIPAKATLSATPSNNMQYLTAIGSKFFEVGVAGRFNGSGSITFSLDYRNLYPLFLMFDTYEYDAGSGTHKFSISNGVRVPSFSIRYKKLNRMVGGPKDETTTILGCVCTGFNVKQNSGSATLDTTVNFSFQRWRTDYSPLTETDYPDYYEDEPPLPVEWTCLFVGDESVAGTESSGFNTSNNATTVIGCGSRFDSNYTVGKFDVSITTSVYSNNPERYLALMYSGGVDDQATEPRSKALQPIPEVSLRSSETVDSEDYSLVARFKDVYVNQGGATSFSDSKITESPTLKAKSVTLEFKNGMPQYSW